MKTPLASRSRRRNRPVGWIVAVAIFLSAVVEAVLFVSLHAIANQEFFVPELPAADRLFAIRLTEIKKKKKEERDEETELKGQVVTVPKPVVEKKPKKSKYLSQYNTRVKRETKAPKRVRGQSQNARKHTNRNRPKRVKEQRKKVAKASDKPKQVAMLDRPEKLHLPKREIPKRPKGQVPLARSYGLMLPSMSMDGLKANMRDLSGRPGSDDYLPEVPEGNETLLNSRRFKYWDFFNRVKEQVRQQWRPGEVYRQRDPTGKMYGVQDRLTVLRITLNSDGRLIKMMTVKHSGIDFLDDEARRAFKAAHPFPNPPKGLQNEYGLITFHFGFLFEISSSSHRFRLWRRM